MDGGEVTINGQKVILQTAQTHADITNTLETIQKVVAAEPEGDACSVAKKKNKQTILGLALATPGLK